VANITYIVDPPIPICAQTFNCTQSWPYHHVRCIKQDIKPTDIRSMWKLR